LISFLIHKPKKKKKIDSQEPKYFLFVFLLSLDATHVSMDEHFQQLMEKYPELQMIEWKV